MVQSYKQNPDLESNYDNIFIGSGMGCLSAAALLAKEGQKSLILEQHYTPGGYTHVFKRKGFEWDVGIHYIGEMQREKSAMRKLFDYITDAQLKWADMGAVYDRILIGDKTYDLVRGVKNFKDQLKADFPEDTKAIDAYVDLIFKANRTGASFYASKAIPPFFNSIAGGLMRRPYLRYADKTTYQVLRELTSNEELIKVLCGQYGDYGLPPKKSSFIMHATLVRHYFDGGSFPVGGSSQIVKTIDPIIEKAGGTILINAEVDQIILEGDTAVGVKMKDGKKIMAKRIVSGTGLVNTYKRLLSNDVVKRFNLDSQLQKVQPSASHACLYLGLEGSPEELQLPKTNYWLYPDDLDHDACVDRYLKNTDEDFPVVYISFPASKDPDFQNRYPGKSTIDIITLVPYEQFAKWDGTRWMKRGEDYEALKDSLTQRLISKLTELFPQVKGRIKHSELSTPLSTKYFTKYETGEIYGLDHSPSRFRQKFLQPRTPIHNFYLTGQDIVTAGIGGALFAGLLTASAMTGKNFMKKILKS